MKVVIGADHAGYQLKLAVVKLLRDAGHQVEDMGCHSTESVDYPDIAFQVADLVRKGGGIGLLICGTGIGMSIAANKVKGIRAACCHNEYEAKMCRNHNDANILCMGSRVLDPTVALSLVNAFLAEPFDGGRHERRVGKIMALES